MRHRYLTLFIGIIAIGLFTGCGERIDQPGDSSTTAGRMMNAQAYAKHKAQKENDKRIAKAIADAPMQEMRWQETVKKCALKYPLHAEIYTYQQDIKSYRYGYKHGGPAFLLSRMDKILADRSIDPSRSYSNPSDCKFLKPEVRPLDVAIRIKDYAVQKNKAGKDIVFTSYDVVKRLLKAGANPNLTTSTWRAPLHTVVYATKSCERSFGSNCNSGYKVAQGLLKHGADPNNKFTIPWREKEPAVTALGFTEWQKMKSLLIKHGAK